MYRLVVTLSHSTNACALTVDQIVVLISVSATVSAFCLVQMVLQEMGDKSRKRKDLVSYAGYQGNLAERCSRQWKGA